MMRMQGRAVMCGIGLLGAVLVGLLLSAHPAFAQAGGSAGTFSCSGGHATGSLYSTSASCPTTMSFSNIFSFLVCNMEKLSTNLLGNMFCGMITTLAPAVSAVLVLAVVIFGMGFTIGVIEATAKEFQMFLIKIAFVWVFATQSDYLIGIAYAFFINGIRDGVAIALSGYAPSTTTAAAVTGPLVYGEMDKVLSTIIGYATDYIGQLGKTAGGTTSAAADTTCQNAVFAALAIVGLVFPPIFFLAITLVFKVFLTFSRAVFSYIYALVGTAFLLTLAPFFLSFFLFKQTRGFFDKWIGYLASYALQVVILFAFLSFILSMNVSNMTYGFTKLVMHDTRTAEGTSFRAPWSYCTLCDFHVVDASGAEIDATNANYFTAGKPVCKLDSTGAQVPITLLTAASPAALNSTQKNALFQFAGGGLLSLLVLAFVVDRLLDYVAALAQMLAGGFGGTYAPQLGGGQTFGGRPVVQMPGEAVGKDFTRGFERGYSTGSSSTSIGATIGGFTEGARTLVQGDGDKKNGDADSGMVNRFIDFVVDPNGTDGS